MSVLRIIPLSFEWDGFNKEKNWKKHEVNYRECEEVFLNNKLKIYPDEGHSELEKRYLCLGITSLDRKLTVIFTIRNNKIRVISARDMSKKERREYEKK